MTNNETTDLHMKPHTNNYMHEQLSILEHKSHKNSLEIMHGTTSTQKHTNITMHDRIQDENIANAVELQQLINESWTKNLTHIDMLLKLALCIPTLARPDR